GDEHLAQLDLLPLAHLDDCERVNRQRISDLRQNSSWAKQANHQTNVGPHARSFSTDSTEHVLPTGPLFRTTQPRPRTPRRAAAALSPPKEVFLCPWQPNG